MAARWTNRPEGSNWGDFGPDDQLGRINLLTPERVVEAVKEVKTGKSFCLSLPLDLPGGRALNPRRFPPKLYATARERTGLSNYNFTASSKSPGMTDVISDNSVLMSLQYSTQWDSFAHVGSQFDANGDGIAEIVYYNGWNGLEHLIAPTEDLEADPLQRFPGVRAKALGIETMAETCVQGRGVMIDLRKHLGDDRTVVDFAMLEKIMADDDVVVEEGDMVCVHTGFSQRLMDMAGNPDPEVLHKGCATLDGGDPRLQDWIRDTGLSVLIGDNYAVEEIPNPRAKAGKPPLMPIHELCLFKLGIHLGEMFYLTELAEWLAANGRSRFLLTAPPLRLPGAVGSPANSGCNRLMSKPLNDRPAVSTLKSLVNPASIAVIGASDDPSRIGGRPLAYIQRAGFKGDIFPVNPKRDTVQGLKAYPSVADLPRAPEACIIAVPAPIVPETLEACVAKGVKAAVLFSSGFAEMGAEGQAAQDRIRRIARDGGLRLLGPNCLGIFNAHSGWMATFSSSVDNFLPEPGPVAIASQSGAYGSHVFALLRKSGVNTGIWITTGNEADVDLADAIGYLAEDEQTKVIVSYAEGIRDGDALRASLQKASDAGKPVIMMKVGRSAVGAAAAASHTAALAGSDRVYDALFRQYGVVRVDSTDQLLDAAYAASRGRFPAGNRIGLMTISGGVGVQMADAADDLGLDVAPMPEETQAKLKALLPFAAVRNPVDITAQAFNDVSLISENLRIMLEEGNYDAIVAFFTMIASSKYIADDLIKTLATTREQFPDKVILLSLIGSSEIVRYYEDGGYPVFEDPTRAVSAAASLMKLGRFFARRGTDSPPDAPKGAPKVPAAPLSEPAAMSLLAKWGVPFVRHRLAGSAGAAAEAASKLGGKVVLKIASPDILHKTEVGGVMIGVGGGEDGEVKIRAAYRTLLDRVRGQVPDARIEGVLVAEMAPEGVEAVIGVQRDPTFGPVVMVGLGGILVEVLEDVAFRLAPFGVEEARRMIAELKGAKIFDGVRGAPATDVDALAELLAKVSVFAAAEADRIESVDLNPVRVLPKGQGVVALDALVLGAKT